jgi:hypothetical protein
MSGIGLPVSQGADEGDRLTLYEDMNLPSYRSNKQLTTHRSDAKSYSTVLYLVTFRLHW